VRADGVVVATAGTDGVVRLWRRTVARGCRASCSARADGGGARSKGPLGGDACGQRGTAHDARPAAASGSCRPHGSSRAWSSRPTEPARGSSRTRTRASGSQTLSWSRSAPHTGRQRARVQSDGVDRDGSPAKAGVWAAHESNLPTLLTSWRGNESADRKRRLLPAQLGARDGSRDGSIRVFDCALADSCPRTSRSGRAGSRALLVEAPRSGARPGVLVALGVGVGAYVHTCATRAATSSDRRRRRNLPSATTDRSAGSQTVEPRRPGLNGRGPRCARDASACGRLIGPVNGTAPRCRIPLGAMEAF